MLENPFKPLVTCIKSIELRPTNTASSMILQPPTGQPIVTLSGIAIGVAVVPAQTRPQSLPACTRPHTGSQVGCLSHCQGRFIVLRGSWHREKAEETDRKDIEEEAAAGDTGSGNEIPEPGIIRVFTVMCIILQSPLHSTLVCHVQFSPALIANTDPYIIENEFSLLCSVQ